MLVCLSVSLPHTHTHSRTLQLWLSSNKVASSSGKKWAELSSVWLLPSTCDNTSPVCMWVCAGVHVRIIVCLYALIHSFIHSFIHSCVLTSLCVCVCVCVCVCNEAWHSPPNTKSSYCSLFRFLKACKLSGSCYCSCHLRFMLLFFPVSFRWDVDVSLSVVFSVSLSLLVW